MKDLITLKYFYNAVEANITRSILQSREIDVFLQNENANTLYGGAISVALQVRPEDQEVAREILEEIENNRFESVED